jgi:acetyltransferase-like isoleucine patch superfamily enzyme
MILRKIRSAFLKIYKFSRCKIVIFGFRYFQEGITIGSNVYIEKGVRLNSTDGGVINIASNAYIGGHSSLIARGGKIEIGKNVFIAHGCILVSQSMIEIGDDTLLGDYVVIRDQDHSYSSRPIRDAGFKSTSVSIGVDCWIGAKASILRGSVVSDGAVVGAHALVRGYVPPYSLVGGVPAKVLKLLQRP